MAAAEEEGRRLARRRLSKRKTRPEAGGCEENDAAKNRIKARKFNAMLKAGQLPSWLPSWLACQPIPGQTPLRSDAIFLEEQFGQTLALIRRLRFLVRLLDISEDRLIDIQDPFLRSNAALTNIRCRSCFPGPISKVFSEAVANRQDAEFFMQLAGGWKIGIFSKSSSLRSPACSPCMTARRRSTRSSGSRPRSNSTLQPRNFSN